MLLCIDQYLFSADISLFTFPFLSIAIFCACLALSFGVEIVVFSTYSSNPLPTPVQPVLSARPSLLPVAGPARRASRKLLERMVSRALLSLHSVYILHVYPFLQI